MSHKDDIYLGDLSLVFIHIGIFIQQRGESLRECLETTKSH